MAYLLWGLNHTGCYTAVQEEALQMPVVYKGGSLERCQCGVVLSCVQCRKLDLLCSLDQVQL